MKKYLIWLPVVAIVLMVIYAGVAFREEKEPDPYGNLLILSYTHSTTAQKEAMRSLYINQSFDFAGQVEDVRTEVFSDNPKQFVSVRIEPGQYANVFFDSNMTWLNKGQLIRFSGRLTRFGTGVLIPHRIDDASFVIFPD